jgi:hypothetical protein
MNDVVGSARPDDVTAATSVDEVPARAAGQAIAAEAAVEIARRVARHEPVVAGSTAEHVAPHVAEVVVADSAVEEIGSAAALCNVLARPREDAVVSAEAEDHFRLGRAAIRRPSGDHEGRSPPSGKRTGVPPLASITYVRRGLKSVQWKFGEQPATLRSGCTSPVKASSPTSTGSRKRGTQPSIGPVC